MNLVVRFALCALLAAFRRRDRKASSNSDRDHDSERAPVRHSIADSLEHYGGDQRRPIWYSLAYPAPFAKRCGPTTRLTGPAGTRLELSDRRSLRAGYLGLARRQ